MDTTLRVKRRHKVWPEALKREIVAACAVPGASVSMVARQYDVNANQVFTWRKLYTIARVAEMLGEDEDWLGDVANEMDQEDGLIWAHGSGDEGVMAFTDFGIGTLRALIEINKENPDLLTRSTDPP